MEFIYRVFHVDIDLKIKLWGKICVNRFENFDFVIFIKHELK